VLKLLNTAEIIDELIEIAKEIRKKLEEGKKLDLTEKELAFYDMLLKEKEFFENEEEIKYLAKEIINRLGYFIKIVDWNKKETLRAQIKMELKRILSNTIGKKAEWQDIERIADQIDEHIELLYAA